MRTKDVLQLMSAAPERYKTVRAALVYRGNGPKIKAMRERYAHSEAGPRTFSDSPDQIWHPEPDSAFGWRQELDLPDGEVDIKASNGTRRFPIGGPPGSNKVWHRRRFVPG